MKYTATRAASCAGKGRFQVKKFFAVFLVVIALAFVVALPAVASPPGALPAIEASSLVANAAPIYALQEPAPVVGVEASQVVAPTTSITLEREAIPIICMLIIATAAMLAGLMSGFRFNMIAQGKYVRMVRDIAYGFGRGRRWVQTALRPSSKIDLIE